MYPVSTNNGPPRDLWADAGFLNARDQRAAILRYFGFREPPFGVTPNPEFLFSSSMHLAALQSMIQSIESNLGFTVLLGDPGMGKTTLLIHLLTQYRDTARTAFIFQTQCKRYDLLRYLASELELPIRNRDEVSLHRRLKEMLVNEARAGRKVLIIVDEAQNLQHSSLEAIRLLSDFETARVKLMHIVLAGSAQLGETLLAPELSQLAQRISTVCRLEPLDPEEVSAYVTFRLEVAGCKDARSLFSPESLAEVAEQSAGIPRMINSICHRSLSLAYATGERHVSSKLVRQAARDLDLSRSSGLNLSPSDHSPSTDKPDTRVSEDEDTALDSNAMNPAPPEAGEPEEERRFRPAEGASVVNRVVQISSSQTQSTMVPKANRSAGHLPEAGGRRNSAQYAGALPSLRRKFGNFQNDRSALVLAALILVALGLLAGWYGLRTKSDAAVARDSVGVEPMLRSAESKDQSSSPKNQSSSLFDIPQINPLIAAGDSNTNRAGRKLIGTPRTQAMVEALPQNLLPSKLRPSSVTPPEATAPSTASISTTSTSHDLMPSLTAVPGSFSTPYLDARAPMNESATDVSQTSSWRPVKMVQPEYPKLAKLRHVEGDVLLELQIDSSGNVHNVRTLTGNALLREAAEDAARQWQYPPTPNHLPSPGITRVRFNFKLNPETKR